MSYGGMVDLWVRSDHQGRNIHPYVEIGAALALFPPFDIAEADADGVRFVALRTGERLGKFESCGNECHVVLKLGGVVAAIAPGQVQSYVPGGVFRTLFKRTAKSRFYMCDFHGRVGHGACAANELFESPNWVLDRPSSLRRRASEPFFQRERQTRRSSSRFASL
jgi:hypothetical protein